LPWYKKLLSPNTFRSFALTFVAAACGQEEKVAMGRAMRWIKKVFAGKKEGDRGGKEHGFAGGTGPPVEKRRWSFARARKSVTDVGRRPSVTAVVAGELTQVRPCCCGQERDVDAAVVIQNAFRGYLVCWFISCYSWFLAIFVSKVELNLLTKGDFRYIICFALIEFLSS
jgi:hypothetical protein